MLRLPTLPDSPAENSIFLTQATSPDTISSGFALHPLHAERFPRRHKVVGIHPFPEHEAAIH